MRMAQLERHLRKNAQLTFCAELSVAAPSSVEEEARRTGHFVYWNARAAPGSPAHLDRPYLVADDLEPLLGADADAAFAVLDADGDGAATLEECVAAVEGILRERRNLAAALADARSMVAILETIIGVLLHTLFVFFYLAIFDANIGQVGAAGVLGAAGVCRASLVLCFLLIFLRRPACPLAPPTTTHPPPTRHPPDLDLRLGPPRRLLLRLWLLRAHDL
jgi:hypothetical protein